MSGANRYVTADGAAIGMAPALVSLHQRAIITGAAGPLGSFITAIGQAELGIPYYLQNLNDTVVKTWPKAVDLQIESGTGVVYMTTDGHDIALGDVSATLGLSIIPVAPSWTRVPVDMNPRAGANVTGLVRVLASAGTVNVQCVFEF